MKDSFWVAVAYGIVEEAKRMNVNMTLYEAGGYENLPKQLSQSRYTFSLSVDAAEFCCASSPDGNRHANTHVATARNAIDTPPWVASQSYRANAPVLTATPSLCSPTAL